MATEFHMSPLQMSNDLSLERNDPTIRHRPFSAGKQSPTLPLPVPNARKMTKWGVRKGFWGGGCQVRVGGIARCVGTERSHWTAENRLSSQREPFVVFSWWAIYTWFVVEERV
ncbi:hypothetical protein CDAR_280161 [Caerostris darwini]|uniref:Uncharacterized protein n=1 Tax=Caerostris darwini TaxID=1538125 RepID=A0AAV4Q0B5_9ARAC|nr:hypothetical protein CDAR_280161 [Caerostris darwini]